MFTSCMTLTQLTLVLLIIVHTTVSDNGLEALPAVFGEGENGTLVCKRRSTETYIQTYFFKADGKTVASYPDDGYVYDDGDRYSIFADQNNENMTLKIHAITRDDNLTKWSCGITTDDDILHEEEISLTVYYMDNPEIVEVSLEGPDRVYLTSVKDAWPEVQSISWQHSGKIIRANANSTKYVHYDCNLLKIVNISQPDIGDLQSIATNEYFKGTKAKYSNKTVITIATGTPKTTGTLIGVVCVESIVLAIITIWYCYCCCKKKQKKTGRKSTINQIGLLLTGFQSKRE